MTDLVRQLREMAGPIVPNVCTQAADEIERSAREVMTLMRMLGDMRKERDEARRMFCTYRGDSHSTLPESVAEEMGWDCFKEEP